MLISEPRGLWFSLFHKIFIAVIYPFS